jgi:hypothetical protein
VARDLKSGKTAEASSLKLDHGIWSLRSPRLWGLLAMAWINTAVQGRSWLNLTGEGIQVVRCLPGPCSWAKAFELAASSVSARIGLARQLSA